MAIFKILSTFAFLLIELSIFLKIVPNSNPPAITPILPKFPYKSPTIPKRIPVSLPT